MRRPCAFLIAAALSVALSACGKDAPADADAKATDLPKAMASAPVSKAVESEYGTPVKDRVATIGLLNKRNNLIQDIVLKPGEARRVGNVVVRLATCERSLPWENPPETGAFVQVFIEERAKSSEPLTWRKVFSGWLFRNSPSLNVVEHPVYDVWVKDCAMKFPGEEEDPAAAASSSSAAKASGRPSTAPAPAASAAPSPAAVAPSPASPAAAAPEEPGA
jgi:hypothetical protein